MKILFLPLFKMPSGHHQVADTLADYIQTKNKKIDCQKVDLLSYSSPFIEKSVAQIYLKWIKGTPSTYDWAYKRFAYTPTHDHCSFTGIEFFFLKKLEKLLREEKPDLVVCTHGFSSLMMSRLKNKQRCHIPVVNVYTDFFINDIWGRTGIDYHLAPNEVVQKQLVDAYGVDDKKIFVSGIPVHHTLVNNNLTKHSNLSGKKTVLVAGGSSGLGNIIGLIQQTSETSGIHYVILCGKNRKLFEDLKALNRPHIEPKPYIKSRAEMNQLYDDAVAIVTKPGGITVSEALVKGVPVFIHSALPGQENINMRFLTDHGLVYQLNFDESFEHQITQVIQNELEQRKWQKTVLDYLSGVQSGTHHQMYERLLSLAMEGSYMNQVISNAPRSRFVKKLKKYAKKMNMTGNA